MTDGMKNVKKMVGGTGIEPVTPCVSSKCSTAELTAHIGYIGRVELFLVGCVANFKSFMPSILKSLKFILAGRGRLDGSGRE